MTGARARASTRRPAPKAGRYVVAKLREIDAAIAEAAPRVLRAADDEAVHDLRVAIRRMRTLLKMSRGLFGRFHTDVVRDAFREVMQATGELRDEEVLEQTLADADAGPELEAWLEERRAREERLRQSVVLRIRRGALDRARELFDALVTFPLDPERDVDLARFARRTVDRARKKVERKRDVDVNDVAGMHELRIAYKELRYSIELLAGALPVDARRELEAATVFQKRLGELHDVDVAIEVVGRARGLSPEARRRVLASLAAMRAKRAAKYLRELGRTGVPPRAAGTARSSARGASGARPGGKTR